jgi:lysozyme
MTTRQLSQAGLELIKSCEALRLQLYDDANGRPWDGSSSIEGHLTIGYGHMLTHEELATGAYRSGISTDLALELLRQDTVGAQRYLRTVIRIELTQHEFDACVSFVFNIGHLTSDLLAALQSGRLDAATITPLFMSVCHYQGKENAGLKIRRAKEVALFLTPDVVSQEMDTDELLATVYESATQIEWDAVTEMETEQTV